MKAIGQKLPVPAGNVHVSYHFAMRCDYTKTDADCRVALPDCSKTFVWNWKKLVSMTEEMERQRLQLEEVVRSSGARWITTLDLLVTEMQVALLFVTYSLSAAAAAAATHSLTDSLKKAGQDDPARQGGAGQARHGVHAQEEASRTDSRGLCRY